LDSDPRGYYAALHVTPAATQADIQRAFRALIRLHHPDVGSVDANQGRGGADVRSILAAFAVLRDPAARAEYDGHGRGPDGNTTNSPGTAGAAERGRAADNATPAGVRDIPVRHHRARGPALRVTPVRWERGPEEGHT
jgi:curved DNA-binding protein CbpA